MANDLSIIRIEELVNSARQKEEDFVSIQDLYKLLEELKSEKNITCQRLNEIIDLSGLKQQEIAEKIGYTPQYVSYVLNGKRPSTKEFIEKISKLLNVNEDYILGISDYKNAKDFWLKSNAYHLDLEQTFINLLNLLDISFEPIDYFIEKSEYSAQDLKNRENTKILSIAQVWEVSTPKGKYHSTEDEFYKSRDRIINMIISEFIKDSSTNH